MKSNTYFYKAKILNVYDADTVTALVDLGFGISTKMKIRLHGIDAPELRGEERPEGLAARNYLRGMIDDREVVIETIKDKTGKYGRYLGIIYFNDQNINNLLVETQHAIYKDY